MLAWLGGDGRTEANRLGVGLASEMMTSGFESHALVDWPGNFVEDSGLVGCCNGRRLTFSHERCPGEFRGPGAWYSLLLPPKPPK